MFTNSAAGPRVAPTPAVLSDTPDARELSDAATGWQPERAPAGPLSIVISGADQRMLVLRNGVIIGSTPVSMADPVIAPKAYSLRSMEGGVSHWIQVPLPGEAAADARDVTANSAKLSIPDSFRRKVAAILTPGATVVVTPDTLAQGDTGAP